MKAPKERRQIGYQPKAGQPRNPDGSMQLQPIYADEWPGNRQDHQPKE